MSPAVDVSAYAFSWLFILLPLTYFSSREHQIVMLLAVVGLTFAHRHYTLPCELALPLVDAMARARPLLLVPAIACVVAGLGIFLVYEWKTLGLRNTPRLAMALGTTLLSASFLIFNPIHVFMVFAFSHAVEYMVSCGRFSSAATARRACPSRVSDVS